MQTSANRSVSPLAVLGRALLASLLLGVIALVGSLGCAGGPSPSQPASRSPMEIVAARRGTDEIEVRVRILDAEGVAIAEPRVIARVGETARVSIGGGVDAEDPRPKIEIEIDSRFTTSDRGGLVEVSVAAVIDSGDGRVDRPVARLTVGIGPPARVVVG